MLTLSCEENEVGKTLKRKAGAQKTGKEADPAIPALFLQEQTLTQQEWRGSRQPCCLLGCEGRRERDWPPQSGVVTAFSWGQIEMHQPKLEHWDGAFAGLFSLVTMKSPIKPSEAIGGPH